LLSAKPTYVINSIKTQNLTGRPNIVQIPHFPESKHPHIESLFHHSDGDLVTLFQNYPENGRYFAALFCRYSPIVYTIIRHSARSPVQADYLFALTWQHIFFELSGLDLRASKDSGPQTFQSWLIDVTAFCINQTNLPPVELIHYSLQKAPPPLWCYVSQALEMMPPLLRFVLLMSETFHWSETRIAAYLQAEGERISTAGICEFKSQADRALKEAIPEDILEIYSREKESLQDALESASNSATMPSAIA